MRLSGAGGDAGAWRRMRCCALRQKHFRWTSNQCAISSAWHRPSAQKRGDEDTERAKDSFGKAKVPGRGLCSSPHRLSGDIARSSKLPERQTWKCVKKRFQITAFPAASRRLIQIGEINLRPNVRGVAQTRPSADAKIPAQVRRTSRGIHRHSGERIVNVVPAQRTSAP